MIKKFEDYCAEQQNEIYERHVFRTIRVLDNADLVEQFIRNLRQQLRYCNLGQHTDLIIRDQVLYGIPQKQIARNIADSEILDATESRGYLQGLRS